MKYEPVDHEHYGEEEEIAMYKLSRTAAANCHSPAVLQFEIQKAGQGSTGCFTPHAIGFSGKSGALGCAFTERVSKALGR